MTLLNVACVQMCSGRDISENMLVAERLIRQAARAGADLIVTPEMTGWLDQQANVLTSPVTLQDKDTALCAFKHLAMELDVNLIIGSLAIRSDSDDKKYVNRSFLLNRSGQIQKVYDKLHLFDVTLSGNESYHESMCFEAWNKAVVSSFNISDGATVKIGMSICYDLRFPELYQQLAIAGSDIITIPAAFTQKTGEAHWHVLTRARAIETGCFILAAGQGGVHQDGRQTYGHSMIISPWGDILAEADGIEEGVIHIPIELDEVQRCREKIPNLQHRRHFTLPSAE